MPDSFAGSRPCKSLASARQPEYSSWRQLAIAAHLTDADKALLASVNPYQPFGPTAIDRDRLTPTKPLCRILRYVVIRNACLSKVKEC